jgi:hypothetical protein
MRPTAPGAQVGRAAAAHIHQPFHEAPALGVVRCAPVDDDGAFHAEIQESAFEGGAAVRVHRYDRGVVLAPLAKCCRGRDAVFRGRRDKEAVARRCINDDNELAGPPGARSGKRAVVQEHVRPGYHAGVDQKTRPVGWYCVRRCRALAPGTYHSSA